MKRGLSQEGENKKEKGGKGVWGVSVIVNGVRLSSRGSWLWGDQRLFNVGCWFLRGKKKFFFFFFFFCQVASCEQQEAARRDDDVGGASETEELGEDGDLLEL